LVKGKREIHATLVTSEVSMENIMKEKLPLNEVACILLPIFHYRLSHP